MNYRFVNKINKVTLFCIVSLLLSSCGTSINEKLGYNDSYWYSLDYATQNSIMHNHEIVLSLREYSNIPQYKDDKAYTVAINSGSALVLPTFVREKFLPVTFVIENGKCDKIKLNSPDGINFTILHACYYGDELWLDPSEVEPKFANYSARIFRTSLWHNFTYENISTFGYASLRNADITIKSYSE